jgi:hypothetical protein
MRLEDYTPEDHDLAKKLYAERGPAGLIAAQGLSGRFKVSIPRRDGYLAYLPMARRMRLKTNTKLQ